MLVLIILECHEFGKTELKVSDIAMGNTAIKGLLSISSFRVLHVIHW